MTRTNELTAAKAFLTEHCGGGEPVPVLAAVSGGLDSMCLLHLLTVWGREQNLTVTAAHFNHGLRGTESDEDETFVRDWCAAHEIPFVSGRGDVRSLAAQRGLTLEEAAREARYGFLTEQKTTRGCRYVLTAHHADDNAETLLLNLLRGTGLRGLAGIPAERDFLLRPFLRITRGELAAYAAAHNIPHVEDSTNRLDDAARNVLRHQVLPVLRQLNPRAVENMSRTAELLRQDESALDGAAEALLAGAEIRSGEYAVFSLSRIREQPMALASRAVWSVLCRVCGHRKDLTAAHIRAVMELEQGQLSMPYGVTVRREGDTLYFFRNPAAPENQPISMGKTVPFGCWRVTVTDEAGREGTALSLPAGAAVSVTGWSPRDRLNGRTVKRLCAERGIAPAERDGLPVLRIGGQAAAVPWLGLDENFALNRHETAARVIFYKDRGEQA